MNLSSPKTPFMRAVVVCIAASLGPLGCALPQREVRISPHTVSPTKDGAVAFSTPGDLRLAFLREEKSHSVYCAEPMPDVSLGSDQSANGSVSVALSSAQAAAASAASALAQENDSLRRQLHDADLAYEASTGSKTNRSYSSSASESGSSANNMAAQGAYRVAVSVAELGGRTQQVLLAREFLYRLCEARANRFFVDDKAYVSLQNNALKLIQNISIPARPSAASERAELLKRAVEYANAQATLCNAKEKACTASAADDATKRECVKTLAKCMSAIEFPTVPKASQVTDVEPSELTVPDLAVHPDPAKL